MPGINVVARLFGGFMGCPICAGRSNMGLGGWGGSEVKAAAAPLAVFPSNVRKWGKRLWGLCVEA